MSWLGQLPEEESHSLGLCAGVKCLSMSGSQPVKDKALRRLLPNFLGRLGPSIGVSTPPALDGDPPKVLAAGALHTLLLGVLLWLVLYFAAAPLAVVRKGAGFALAGVLTLSVLTSLFCLIRGRVKLAS